MRVRRRTPEGVERKRPVPFDHLAVDLVDELEEIQSEMLDEAVRRREAGSRRGFGSYGELREWLDATPGLAYAGWCGEPACAERAKEDAKATIRVIPDEEFRSAQPPGRCVVCDEWTETEVVWARAY